MKQFLTMKQIKDRFQVKDNRTIQNFIKQGLKFIKVGNEYRFDIEDIERFEEVLKIQEQEKIEEIRPIKQKRKFKTININHEKRKINLTEMRVI